MCKAKCSCLYRIAESTINGHKVYYPEYAKRLFPWRWKRLDITIYDSKTGKSAPLFFKNKTFAKEWLDSFKTNHDFTLADRTFK
jgi:hypothetical protein